MPRNRQDARAATEGESQRLQFFEGFKTEQIKTSGATINTVYGGNRDGAPLLLLCGIPETHVLWRKVAPTLSRDYFIVMTDLRGYGDSSKPPGGGDLFAYSNDGAGSSGSDEASGIRKIRAHGA